VILNRPAVYSEPDVFCSFDSVPNSSANISPKGSDHLVLVFDNDDYNYRITKHGNHNAIDSTSAMCLT
jgi:hypothetical protein